MSDLRGNVFQGFLEGFRGFRIKSVRLFQVVSGGFFNGGFRVFAGAFQKVSYGFRNVLKKKKENVSESFKGFSSAGFWGCFSWFQWSQETAFQGRFKRSQKNSGVVKKRFKESHGASRAYQGASEE